MPENIKVHIFIEGRVQGVFFRDNIRQKAKLFGLKGWVKNLEDGRVEAVLEGETNKVEELINWSKKGPILAKVEKIDVQKENYQGEFDDFEIKI